MSNRLGWDEYFATQAFITSLRSQDPYRKVGAICVSSDNRILSTGYNGLVAGFNPPETLYANREDKEERYALTIHAEINALTRCRPQEVHTVVTTASPCFNCANIIASYGVKRVLYIEEYDREQSFKRIFNFYGIKYGKVMPANIFKSSEDLLVEFPGCVPIDTIWNKIQPQSNSKSRCSSRRLNQKPQTTKVQRISTLICKCWRRICKSLMS